MTNHYPTKQDVKPKPSYDGFVWDEKLQSYIQTLPKAGSLLKPTYDALEVTCDESLASAGAGYPGWFWDEKAETYVKAEAGIPYEVSKHYPLELPAFENRTPVNPFTNPKWVEKVLPHDNKTFKSDGGPSVVYDMDPGWLTANDIIDHKSTNQWKEHSWHLANIFKATWRWGAKDGTTKLYDVKKIMYSGCRLFVMLTSKTELRKYLQQLLDDPQFKDDTIV